MPCWGPRMPNRPPTRIMYNVKSEMGYTGKHDLVTVSYHEAGHAVLARLTHCPLDTIALTRADGEIAGFISNRREISDAFNLVQSHDAALAEPRVLPDVSTGLRKQLAIRSACTSLAGLGAELLLTGHTLTGPTVRNDADHRKARDVLRAAFGFDHLFYCQLTACFYLRRCWDAVRLTAEALLEQCEKNETAVLQKSNPRHAAHFTREFANTKWLDEDWDDE